VILAQFADSPKSVSYDQNPVLVIGAITFWNSNLSIVSKWLCRTDAAVTKIVA